MDNPWLDLPSTAPFVLASDAPTIEAWNGFFADTDRHRIVLELLPEPWVGNLHAPVVVLNLNPGVGTVDRDWHRRSELIDAVRAGLRREPRDFPLYYLDPALSGSGGAAWWKRCLGQLIRDTDIESVAKGVVGLEFHGYHSDQYGGLPVTLPSQPYVFNALRSAISRGAIVVAMRGLRAWATAVPELVDYKLLYRTLNPQTASISPTNSANPALYEAVCEAVRAGA